MSVVQELPAYRLKLPKLRLFGAIALAGALLVGCAAQSTGETTGATPTTKPAMRLWLDNNYTTASSPADLHFVVVALDPESGHLLWRRSLEMSGETFISTSEPVLQEGLVFVTASATTTTSGVQHGFLEALDPNTGQIRWQHEAGTEL